MIRHNLYYEHDMLHQIWIQIRSSTTVHVFMYHCLIMVPWGPKYAAGNKFHLQNTDWLEIIVVTTDNLNHLRLWHTTGTGHNCEESSKDLARHRHKICGRDLAFPHKWLWRLVSSGLWRRVDRYQRSGLTCCLHLQVCWFPLPTRNALWQSLN
jgi:hypothetical protein